MGFALILMINVLAEPPHLAGRLSNLFESEVDSPPSPAMDKVQFQLPRKAVNPAPVQLVAEEINGDQLEAYSLTVEDIHELIAEIRVYVEGAESEEQRSLLDKWARDSETSLRALIKLKH